MAHLIKNLLKRLRENDIYLKVNDKEELEITVKQGKIPSELVEEIRAHKKDILEYLKSSEDDTANKIEKAPESDSYPLSSAQKSLWIVSQDPEASLAYNIPSYSVLKGLKNIDVLDQAIKAVIDRHEILRTVFKNNENGELRQFILNTADLNFKIDYVDFKNESNAQAGISNYIKNDTNTPFDLEKGPLLRVAILEINEQEFCFYYNLHHIISDGWSNDILEKEFLAFYSVYSTKSGINLPELNMQYKDYAVWESSLLASEKMEDYKKYWTEKLSGDLPRLNLPSNKQRPKFQTYNGHQFQTYISPDEVNKLREITQKEGGSLFMSVLSLIKILLYKYTNETDITIGFPMANRDNLNLQDQIGFYIRPLALRNHILPEETFAQFYKKLKDNTFLAFNNKEYPFPILVNDLKIKNDPGRSPIFDISLTFHNTSSENNTEIFNTSKISDLGSNKCKQDIEFHFKEIGNYLSFVLNYNPDVYDSDMVIQFMSHFKELVADLHSNPGKAIKDLNYLSTKEWATLIHEFNNTAGDSPKDKTLVDLFEIQVKETPDNEAVFFEGKSITYKELDVITDRLAVSLRTEHGIEKGDFVGVQLHRSEWYIISFLGILKAGAVYVPIDYELPEDRKSFIISDTGLKLLIVETAFIFDLDFYDGLLFSIDVEFDSSIETAAYQKQNLTPQDLAYVIYTSGSTGNPKGVMIEHAGIVNTIASEREAIGMKNYKNSLQFASFSFDTSIWDIFNTLLSGSALYILSEETRKDVKAFEAYIVENKIDIATLPPAFLKLIDINCLKNLKMLITAGEAAIYDKVTAYLEYGSFYNSFGPTESSISCTGYKVGKGDKLQSTNIPIGKPIKNAQIYILDANLNPCGTGIYGEIYIAGAGLARGYQNREELTSNTFIPNPFQEGKRMYKSGDMGRWLPDGNLEYKGRVDDQVKLHGYRIELGEIENRLSEIEGVKHSVVIVKQDEEDKYLVAYYVSDETLDKNKIQTELSKVLPVFMLPNYYVQLPFIPLTTNRKVDKKALPAVAEKDLIKTQYETPETPEEIVLAKMWSEVLKTDNIGKKDHFYNLGGDSIKSIMIIVKLKELGYILRIDHLLKHPVLEDLAKKLEKTAIQDTTEESQKEAETATSNWKIGDLIPLSPNQKRFYKMKYAAVTLSFRVPDFSLLQFEKDFKAFLSHIPNLTVRYEEINNTVYQRYIAAEDTKIQVLVNEIESNNEDVITQNGKAFLLEQPFDLLQGALIRAFIVPDVIKSDATVVLAIHHSLADAYTTDTILKEAVNYFSSKKEIGAYHHPFEFITLQEKYLNSEEGLEKRKYWVQNLNDQLLHRTYHNNERVDYVEQEIIIFGEKFDKIKDLAIDLNVPVSALFNVFYLMILNKVGNEAKKLYQIFVTGREKEIKGLETDRILGAIDNVLIHNYYENDFDLNIETIRDTYLQYLKERMEQTLPYETMREDFRDASGIDLDANIIGFLNFIISENSLSNIDLLEKVTTIYTKSDASCEVSLICNLFSNGIIVRLISKKDFYEKNTSSLSLEAYIEEFAAFINKKSKQKEDKSNKLHKEKM
ncbi:non-ribosomal peptide synthetase [Flavobacterium branchiicola]|uniref:Non-ribosomal peptide synthetase n=1 Tax=Flavobacterium branchiicola TaxID=1114875 RepID=A0ABV9PHU6_9FLAO|nr:non-ribosomal peptide synthetase [Flavobacterium branchiicola]MBS7256345.1 amino acid adenylation domain-containing protein [Flavobacterium branchiicola]